MLRTQGSRARFSMHYVKRETSRLTAAVVVHGAPTTCASKKMPDGFAMPFSFSIGCFAFTTAVVRLRLKPGRSVATRRSSATVIAVDRLLTEVRRGAGALSVQLMLVSNS